MWSARSSSTIMRTALPTVAGSTPYSWIERGVSLASKWISCMVLSLRSTSARVVIISLTNSPLPPLNSRHRVRKGALVIPAMGASTTGGDTVCGPIARVDPGAAVGVGIAPLSRIRAVPGAQAGVAPAVAATSRHRGRPRGGPGGGGGRGHCPIVPYPRGARRAGRRGLGGGVHQPAAGRHPRGRGGRRGAGGGRGVVVVRGRLRRRGAARLVGPRRVRAGGAGGGRADLGPLGPGDGAAHGRAAGVGGDPRGGRRGAVTGPGPIPARGTPVDVGLAAHSLSSRSPGPGRTVRSRPARGCRRRHATDRHEQGQPLGPARA